MIPQSVVDENLEDAYVDFFNNDELRIATFYPKEFKSCLLCVVFGHWYHQLDEKDEDGKLSRILRFCLRCKVQTLEKFQS